MATIDDLNISITQMESSGVLALIHRLRLSRRTKKNIKMTTRSVQKRKTKVTTSLESMTKQDKLQLIKDLEGME